MKSVKILVIAFIFPSIAISQINGSWHCAFTVMGMSKRMDLEINIGTTDTTVTIKDPDDLKSKIIMVDKKTIVSDSLYFRWTRGRLEFKGNYFSDGDSLVGDFNQGGIKWKGVFTREEQEKKVIIRPQEPISPFPYATEEVVYKNKNVLLAGTLTIPQNGDANFPIVVLASGSGPQNRDCEILGHKPFLVIADYLARNGIASLRFDDRGIGQSTGNYTKATLKDFASDVKSCVSALANDPRFKDHLIGIAGHSEGGMHALIAAYKNKQVDFIIELASVGTSGKDVLIEQQYLIPKKSGASEEMAQWNKALFSGACDIIEKYSSKDRSNMLDQFLNEQYEKAPKEYKEIANLLNFKMGIQLLINNDWGKQFIVFEAKPYLKKIDVPILVLNGSEDIQVPALSNLEVFRTNISKKSMLKSKIVLIEGLNHLFQSCIRCTVDEYGELSETFSEKAMNEMVGWMQLLYPNP